VLGDRHRLAGQQRLVHLQRGRAHQSQIGRDLHARLEQHDVTGHQLVAVDLAVTAVTDHAGMGTTSCISARTAPSALRSWVNPITAFRTSTAAITEASRCSPSSHGHQKCRQQDEDERAAELASNTNQPGVGGSSSSRFGPYRRRRASASWCVSPCPARLQLLFDLRAVQVVPDRISAAVHLISQPATRIVA
jgi:hypothetical protein